MNNIRWIKITIGDFWKQYKQKINFILISILIVCISLLILDVKFGLFGSWILID